MMSNAHIEMTKCGYLSQQYADVFRKFGFPRRLEHSGAFILARPIEGTDYQDAMGLYPLFCCIDWNGVGQDLAILAQEREFVSLVLVTDPLADLNEDCLRSWFDFVKVFKAHQIADLSYPPETYISASRIRQSKRALKHVNVRVADKPQMYVDDWLRLQAALHNRHRLSEIKLLTREGVEALFTVPGVCVLTAAIDGQIEGMHIEFKQGRDVYGHLAAYSDAGRRRGVSSALHYWEILYFMGTAERINWGGASGLEAEGSNGLTSFKAGFSNTTRNTYLCGNIFDATVYEQLCRGSAGSAKEYFPAYRNGEMA